ncbi:hypothetical protein [Culturomica massiliensis]|jgi:hypothetical protein|uniref:hypothetical protein n=1 Tax=Culturomica massiliensis TaxID=1841857 RepID=UPI0023523CFE|nr:hypothetical protein [Culturomica massiliensis]
MRYILFFLTGILLAACSDDTSSLPANRKMIRLSMSTRGIYDFATYIRDLQIFAFKQDMKGEYVFYDKLADLNEQEIRELEEGKSPGTTYTESKLLDTELEIGKYRFYFVGNARAESGGILQEGITRPSDVWLNYPETGLSLPYFLGQTETAVGEVIETVAVELHHVVSRLFIKIDGVPLEIDTIRMSVKNIDRRITLEGEYSEPGDAPAEVFIVKNEKPHQQVTALFDLYIFPSAGETSEIELVFHARNGEERTKLVPVELLPDRYVNLFATINSSYGALLSFEFTCVYFFAFDWQNIVWPDFPLIPQK